LPRDCDGSESAVHGQATLDEHHQSTDALRTVHMQENWNRRANTKQTWLHLRPFIHMAYQRRLQTGVTTAVQGGYTLTGTPASLPKMTSPMTTWLKPSWGLLMRTWQTCWPKHQSPSLPMPIKSTCRSNSWRQTTTSSISSNRHSSNRWKCYLQTLLR
jgi:hypothetical protein